MSYLNHFQTHLDNHDYPALLGLWEEYCLGDTIDPIETRKILLAIKNSSMAENFGRHVENILPLFSALKESPDRYEILKLVFDLQSTNSKELWDLAQAEVKNYFSDSEQYPEKIRILGLRSKGDFQGVISKFELLNHLQKGNFVFHIAGWGVGEIIDSSLLREEVSLEFDYVPGKKVLSFENAFKTLYPLQKDHFLSVRFGNPDLLEERAKNNPREVIRQLLRDLGPKTASEIKDELCELVIPQDDWTKWWQSARSKIKKDTMIDVPSSLSEPFRLRKTEVTHEEELQKALEKKPDATTLIQMLYSFMKDFSDTLKNEAFKTTIEAKLVEMLSFEEITNAQELQIHYFLQDITGKKSYPAIEELIKRFSSIPDIIDAISILALKKRTLIEVRKHRPDWKEIFLNLLLPVDQNPLRDYLFTELFKAKAIPELKTKLEELYTTPATYPTALIWYFQKITGKKETPYPYGDAQGKCRFFEAFFVLLSFLEQTSGSKEMIKKMQQILTKGRFAVVREVMENADLAACQEFMLLATKCHSFSDHEQKIFRSLAEVVHPQLAKKKKGAEEEQLDIIWTTPMGYAKVQEKIKQIATVETVQNAKEIETARGHGDLRENAEFKAALERRDRLQSELKTLSDQINQARIITTDDIPKDEVGIGSVVHTKTASGKTVTYTLLGPWDAVVEKNILAFQSKLAQSMVGKKVGDTFDAHGETHTIEKLEPYIKS